MLPAPSPAPRRSMRSTSVRWVVLVALLLGALLSAFGTASSHGVAALAAVGHDTDNAHGHSHEDDEPAAPSHPHHAHDHSHDKAHALPPGVAAWGPWPDAWSATAPAWVERLTPYRLERPPRNAPPA